MRDDKLNILCYRDVHTRYGLKRIAVPYGRWGNENNWNSIERKASKQTKCLNDNNVFPSIKATAKFYEISVRKVSQSANKGVEIIRELDNKKLQFAFV